MPLRLLRLFLVLAALGSGVCIVGVFATWQQVNSIAPRNGRKTHRLRPDAGLLAADDLRRVHTGRPVVSGAGALAAQIRRGHPVVWRTDAGGRSHPACLRPAAGHRAISLLRRCLGLFC